MKITRLPSRIRAKIIVDAAVTYNRSPCWLWCGATSAEGYGKVRWQDKTVYSHRLVYTLLVGPITQPQLDHLCRRPACCNPRHLEPVTAIVNVQRGSNSTKTACINGHTYNKKTTYIDKKGWRRCRECHRIRVITEWRNKHPNAVRQRPAIIM